MSSLPALLGHVTATLQTHPVCKRTEVIETQEFSSEQFFFKIRVKLSKGYNFQARIYYNRGHIDYAYQLFTDFPFLRWDNKEEFPELETYPHHHHDANGNVTSSPLTGEPTKDIGIVLREITTFLARTQERDEGGMNGTDNLSCM